MAKGNPEIVVNNQIDKVVFRKKKPCEKISEIGIPFLTS